MKATLCRGRPHCLEPGLMQRIVTATDALRPTWRIRSRRTERVRFAMPGAFEPFLFPPSIMTDPVKIGL
jgi:hypothetical protein